MDSSDFSRLLDRDMTTPKEAAEDFEAIQRKLRAPNPLLWRGAALAGLSFALSLGLFLSNSPQPQVAVFLKRSSEPSAKAWVIEFTQLEAER